MTNSKFHWLNSDAIWLQRLTSVELIINHLLAVTVTGAGNDDVNGSVASLLFD